ncbi:hypothetical protein LOK49_LG01G01045 [Camellia lanceoleosa]|uniref:Uncharacterized protein n=1 Tax=Camellia lanceoleosa TaxID=1840588 RepID=A0ACC0J3L9_9ERIC|nr:hypothetical protein LOK49_LG01G01045 [Camellia lanceoleosa]
MVEDAVVLAFAQRQHPNLARQFFSDPKSSGDPKFMEAYGNTDLLIAVMLCFRVHVILPPCSLQIHCILCIMG